MVTIICIFVSQNKNDMKKIGILFMAATALTVASCSSSDEATEDEVKVEAVTYKLDAANSSITWKGQMSADYGHSGTVQMSEGSITMEGEELTSGSFTVDMNTIDDTSLEAPKSDYLSGHLMGTMVDEDHPVDLFFNVPKFPNVEVTLGDYKDGNLAIKLNILGQSLEQNVAVTLSADDNGASIKGSFSLDLESLGIPGFQANEDGSQISPTIEFDLNVAMTK